MTPTFRTSRRPLDGHYPADWEVKRAIWKRDRWLVPVIVAGFVAGVLALYAMGVA